MKSKLLFIFSIVILFVVPLVLSVIRTGDDFFKLGDKYFLEGDLEKAIDNYSMSLGTYSFFCTKREYPYKKLHSIASNLEYPEIIRGLGFQGIVSGFAMSRGILMDYTSHDSSTFYLCPNEVNQYKEAQSNLNKMGLSHLSRVGSREVNVESNFLLKFGIAIAFVGWLFQIFLIIWHNFDLNGGIIANGLLRRFIILVIFILGWMHLLGFS